MFTSDYFLLSLLIAVFSLVYTHILTDTNEVLGWCKKLLYKAFVDEDRLNAGKGYHPLYKVLVQCAKCVSGQIALWSFLIIHFDKFRHISFVLVFQHILFISLTIFITIIITSFYKKYIQ